MTSPLRYILHADLDAFYASVEQRDNPSLRGKPVVVGAPAEQRGVVAAASYEAREYGIHSALPMSTALRRCPTLIRISPRFGRYREISQRTMAVFETSTPLVEPVSLDEAYLDIGELGMTDITCLATWLKNKIWDEVGLIVTIGGGTSKTVAKIASQVAKPNGLLLVVPGEERMFLGPLDVRMLWGIGPKTEVVLKRHGIQTIGDLSIHDQKSLESVLGKRSQELTAAALGLDRRVVSPHRETKSISVETTFNRDVDDEFILNQELEILVKKLAERLGRTRLRGTTVRVKLRLTDFTTFTRQITLPAPINDQEGMYQAATILLSREMRPGRPFRLIGVGLSNFWETSQLHFPLG